MKRFLKKFSAILAALVLVSVCYGVNNISANAATIGKSTFRVYMQHDVYARTGNLYNKFTITLKDNTTGQTTSVTNYQLKNGYYYNGQLTGPTNHSYTVTITYSDLLSLNKKKTYNISATQMKNGYHKNIYIKTNGLKQATISF